MVQRIFPALVLACAPVIFGCEKTPEPTPTAPPPRPAAMPETSASPASAAAPKGPTDVAYDVPEGWQKAENPSPMRKATLKIPRAAGDTEDGELSVTQFGGTVDQNVQRWFGQFEGAKEDATSRRKQKVGDLDVTVVELHGTYNGGGMPGAPAGPKQSWALLGAIVETQGSLTFFKLTGPEKTITAAKPAFEKLVSSFRAK